MKTKGGLRIKKVFLLASFAVTLAVVGADVLATDSPVTLSFWTFLAPYDGTPRGNVLGRIVDEFNRANPDIQVKVETIHWRDIDGKAIMATAAGVGPDILNVYSVQLPRHIEAGTLQPIEDLLEPWFELHGADYVFSHESLFRAGHIWSMFWETRVWITWYRADYLEELGLSYPKTLDELVQVGAAITRAKPGVIGYALGLSTASLAAEFVETFEIVLKAAGGNFFDGTGRTIVDSEAGIRAMNWVKSLFDSGAATLACVEMTADDVLAGVRAGVIAMATEGSMRVTTARDGPPPGTLLTAPTPSFVPGVPAPALVAGQTLGIGANCRHRDAAWRFIEYYLSKEVQALWAVNAGLLPVRLSVLEDPYFTETPTGREIMGWVKLAKEYGFTTSYPADFPYFSQLLAEAAQRVVLLGVPVEEALRDVARTYNAKFAD